MVMLAIRGVHLVITLFHFKPFHIHRLEDFHTKTPRLFGHTLGKFLSADPFGEAGEVIESNGDPGLPAETRALDEEHIGAFAGRTKAVSDMGAPFSDSTTAR